MTYEVDDDTPLVERPTLSRSASQLARDVALSRLTGEPLPPLPLPTTSLSRAGTVAGVLTTNGGGTEERAEARVNLMRKLSARRLERGGSERRAPAAPEVPPPQVQLWDSPSASSSTSTLPFLSQSRPGTPPPLPQQPAASSSATPYSPSTSPRLPPPIALPALADPSPPDDPLWALKQRRLGAKVEAKVAASRSRVAGQGPFPPPEEGYTFPSPSIGSPSSQHTSSTDDDVNGDGWKGQFFSTLPPSPQIASGFQSYQPLAMPEPLPSSPSPPPSPPAPPAPIPRLPPTERPADRILRRLEALLPPSTESDTAGSTNSPLSHPPRKLLLNAPVLQIVNAHTVKDRHLFLFTDLLVIAKPILTDDAQLSSLDTNRFLVKSIVELRHLNIVAENDENDKGGPAEDKKRHPLLVSFIDRFANDPRKAIKTLIEKGGLHNDAATIATLLFRNTDLNRNSLGTYLAAQEHRHVLRAYLERFRFSGVRIDDALRMFLMTLRIPHTLNQAEYVLGIFGLQWTDANTNTGFDPSLTYALVLAIMRLSDALHGANDALFSLPNSAITAADFVAAFRESDPRHLVSEDLLVQLWESVKRDRVEEASDNSMFSMTPDIEATIVPGKIPTRLRYRQPSERFTITVPERDPHFFIKLHGVDLVFDPPILTFSKETSQSFTVTGTALGLRAMVLIKLGRNAPRYTGIPITKTFAVERAFLFHTFQIAFPSEDRGAKRVHPRGHPTTSPSVPSSAHPSGTFERIQDPAKAPKNVTYMFTTLSPLVRATWLTALRHRVRECTAVPLPDSKALRAANAVSIQVLRDALIPPEDLNSAAPSSLDSSRPRTGRLGTPTNRPTRSTSISRTYPLGAGKKENDLVSEKNNSRRTKEEVPEGTKEGAEIALVTEQNSLLPLVLSFLGAGAEVAPNPTSREGSAFLRKEPLVL